MRGVNQQASKWNLLYQQKPNQKKSLSENLSDSLNENTAQISIVFFCCILFSKIAFICMKHASYPCFFVF